MRDFFRPYLLTDGRSLEGVIVFFICISNSFIYDDGVGRKIRQDRAYFLFGVWFLSVEVGIFLMGGGSFWSGNGSFHVEVGGWMWTHEKSHRE
ncbi:MAG: hypothetical protein PHG64_15225 [Paludibacter sp.]|nr:hypothetical protein [Paludibacter sp.]